MTYARARPVLVSIVAGTTGLTKVLGLGDKLVHDKTLNDRVFGAFRHFGVRLLTGARHGPWQLVANIVGYEVEVFVDYPDAGDAAAIDAAIVADYEAVSARLANQQLWARATSGLRVVGARKGQGDDDPLFEFSVDEAGTGRRLRVRFPIEVTSV